MQGKYNIKEIVFNSYCLESEPDDDWDNCDISLNELDEGVTDCYLRRSVVEVESLWRNIWKNKPQ